MTVSSGGQIDTAPKRRLIRTATLLIVLVAALAGGAWWFTGERDRELTSLADPHVVDLPPAPDDPAPTAAFFAGPGAPVVTAVRSIDWDRLEATEDECGEAAGALDAISPPAALRDITLEVPDDITGDMARSFIDTSIAFIGRCLAGDGPDPADVRFASVVFENRLEQIGA